MANLGSVLEFYRGGLCDIDYDLRTNKEIAMLSGNPITREQAGQICSMLGWSKTMQHPFEVIKKSKSYLKAILKAFGEYEMALEDLDVIWYNTRVNGEMKYYDRAQFRSSRTGRGFTLTFGMPNTGGHCALYDSSHGDRPIYSARTVASVLERATVDYIRRVYK